MSRPRYCPDPFLDRISMVIPDASINEFYPANYPSKLGKPFALTTAQYYRIHLLSLLKGITSFNKLCSELFYHQSYRRFCHIKAISKVPKPNTLSDFRSHMGAEAFGLINDILLRRFFSVVSLPQVVIAVPDSTDLEASCSGLGKKNVLARQNANAEMNTQRRERAKATAPRNRGNRNIFWDIKSTP
jgi:hypothetical protein